MRKFIWYILNKLKVASIVQLVLKSSLKEDGWFKSYYEKQAIDKKGNPIPWCSYPFIKFIEPRLKPSFEVFEYGCGNSTIWFANKVKNITSVEHHKEWYNNISKKLPNNAKVVFKELMYDGEYSKAIFDENKKYNIIIIDGRDRANCVKNAIKSLSDDGIIVFDNAGLKQYQESIELIMLQKFRRIDFIGATPVIAHNNTTSIFYRNNNCLKI